MQNIIFGLASFLASAFAFGYGAFGLFKKKKPLYLQLFACAAGCLSIEQLAYLVNILCGITEPFSISMLGIFGCNFFLLSANYGTLDKIVDDGKGSKNARLIAVIAPVITAALAAFAFISWMDRDMLCAVMWLLILIPALPASYFNLKHILLPIDPFEFLKVSKPCNIAALTFYAVTSLYVICSASAGDTAVGILALLMSVTVLLMTVFAVKGAKKWGI